MKRDNIILITIDTLRRDHCSCYGYERMTTPFLDSIAKKGVKFNHAFANGPLTPRSFPSILCGVSTFAGKEDDISSCFLPQNIETIAERLEKRGYYTVAFQAGNPYLSKYYGYDRGFREYKDYLKADKKRSKAKGNKLILSLFGIFPKIMPIARKVRTFGRFTFGVMEKKKRILSKDLPFKRGREINADVKTWLNGYGEDGPLFLWIHYMDCHQPYIPDDNARKELGIREYSVGQLARHWAEINDKFVRSSKQIQSLVDLYDCEIKYEDQVIEELFETMIENSINENNSAFIITSDHGDEFGEHGGLGHELKLYNEMLSVPLIFYGKGCENYKSFSESLVELKSIPNVILELAEHDRASPLNNRFIISECLREEKGKYVRLISIQNRDYKLIYDCGNEVYNEFYNLEEDKYEQTNLIDDRRYEREILEMKGIINKICTEKPGENTGEKLNETEAEVVKKRLRDLGYLD